MDTFCSFDKSENSVYMNTNKSDWVYVSRMQLFLNQHLKEIHDNLFGYM